MAIWGQALDYLFMCAAADNTGRIYTQVSVNSFVSLNVQISCSITDFTSIRYATSDDIVSRQSVEKSCTM